MDNCCPTCGAELVNSLAWVPEEQLFITPFGRVRLSPVQTRIMDALWVARKRGGIKNQEMFMQAVYGHIKDGGPKSFCVLSIHIARIRTVINPIGYTITNGIHRKGWQIIKLNGEFN